MPFWKTKSLEDKARDERNKRDIRVAKLQETQLDTARINAEIQRRQALKRLTA